MSEFEDDRETGPEDVFGGLRERPTPEIDSQGLWRRIEAQLTPRAGGEVFARSRSNIAAVRIAYGLAAMVVLAFAAWIGSSLFSGPSNEGQLVLLTPVDPDGVVDDRPAPGVDAGAAAVLPEESRRVTLDVRLVRGFDGAPPEDVSSARALGVGGADALLDARSGIESLFPFEDFGLVGVWRGEVASGAALDAELSNSYRLVAGSTEAAGDVDDIVLLSGIALAGSGENLPAADLRLEPGRLYILGVRGAGAETANLVLLLRIEAATEPPGERR